MCQCPLGLELLRGYSSQHVVSDGFNALSGLSCYKLKAYEETGLSPFQCPLGLELLPASSFDNTRESKFQCPLGLELLQQECPIF